MSLTENPEKEILFAQQLSQALQTINPEYFAFENGIFSSSLQEPNQEKWWATIAAMAGLWYAKGNLQGMEISHSNFSKKEEQEVIDTILQVAHIKQTKTEIIACPSCGRTQYDIQSVLALVKERFSNYPNLKIGIMGCVVNGPGEMADADIGVVGSANQKIAIYKQGEKISKFLPIEEALQQLEKEIHAIIDERKG